MIALEVIKSVDGEIIAIIIRKSFKKAGVNFVSESDFPLQLGINSYAKGDTIKPHVHLNREVTIKSLQEVIYIRRGSALVNIFDSNRALVKSIKLSTADLIFFASGGHGFEMLKDTTIIEVKQGPYFGKELDKATIE